MGSDLYRNDSIDGACGFHHLLYLTRFDAGSVVLHRPLTIQVKGGKYPHPYDEQENNQHLSLG
jgi:hypothetical protein